MKLTAAGWLPPALVTEAMDALWPEDRWIGKRNREDLTEPVRRLRASAQRAGLVRASRGQLLVTKAGTALRDDPHGMFLHLAERLSGRPRDAFGRTATPLVLVAVAAGRSDRQPLAELLTAAGWVTGGGGAVSPYAPAHAASDALEVLHVAGAWHDIDWRNRVVTPVGRAGARARRADLGALTGRQVGGCDQKAVMRATASSLLRTAMSASFRPSAALS